MFHGFFEILHLPKQKQNKAKQAPPPKNNKKTKNKTKKTTNK